MNPSGKFFHDIWINAYEVSFDEVEDKLPSEIYDWFMSLGAQSAKVYQPWYAAFGRVSKPENIDPNNPNNLIHIYEDMTISYERMYELDPVAATWLLETKQAVHFNLAKIKKDIYCLFLSSNASAIFDEETADAILSSFTRPVMTYAVQHVKDKLELYEDITDKRKRFLISVDPAFSSKGDFLSITVINIDTKALAGHLRTRTGKIEYISDIVVDIHTNLLPNSPIVVERNNFGKAVLENLEKVPSVLKKLFFYYEKKKDKKFDTSEKIYGINTTKENREKYFNTLMNLVCDDASVVKSKKLGEELITLEMKNGKIQAMSGCHDDSVLSYGIGLYVIEYKAQFLFAFTKTKQEFEINLSKLVILNDKSLNSSEMTKGILENKLQIMHDERTLTEEILGDFFGQADQMFKNHINIFNKFNS